MMVVNVDVEIYRLYNGLRARDLMPSLCRDFCDFHKSLPCFLPFFAVFSTVPSGFQFPVSNTGGRSMLPKDLDHNTGPSAIPIKFPANTGY